LFKVNVKLYCYLIIHGKNGFAERFKILGGDQKSNFVELCENNCAQTVTRISAFSTTLLIIFKVSNYFDDPTKLFSDLYPAKF